MNARVASSINMVGALTRTLRQVSRDDLDEMLTVLTQARSQTPDDEAACVDEMIKEAKLLRQFLNQLHEQLRPESEMEAEGEKTVAKMFARIFRRGGAF